MSILIINEIIEPYRRFLDQNYKPTTYIPCAANFMICYSGYEFDKLHLVDPKNYFLPRSTISLHEEKKCTSVYVDQVENQKIYLGNKNTKLVY
jgi:hypothetical protein